MNVSWIALIFLILPILIQLQEIHVFCAHQIVWNVLQILVQLAIQEHTFMKVPV